MHVNFMFFGEPPWLIESDLGQLIAWIDRGADGCWIITARHDIVRDIDGKRFGTRTELVEGLKTAGLSIAFGLPNSN